MSEIDKLGSLKDYILNNLIIIDFDKLWEDYNKLSKDIGKRRIISWIELVKDENKEKLVGNICIKIK